MVDDTEKTQSIGVLGGTFDPPHLAHLNIALEAREQLNLDRVFWTITPEPPHKQSRVAASILDRATMLSLMIAPYPFFILSTVDMDRPGPYYAADTLKIIADQNEGAKLVYIIGSDLLSNFAGWVRVKDLVSTCDQIGVVARQGRNDDIDETLAFIPEAASKFRKINISPINLSSHDIRERIRSGGFIREMVTEPVFQYIQEHRLYLQNDPVNQNGSSQCRPFSIF